MFKEFHEYEEMMKPKIPETYGKDGRILQCNQGAYKWTFGESEDKTCITM